MSLCCSQVGSVFAGVSAGCLAQRLPRRLRCPEVGGHGAEDADDAPRLRDDGCAAKFGDGLL